MHSSRHTAIPIEAWHEGRYDWRNDTLEVADGQYVDIQLLKILVEALWPDLDKPMSMSPTRTPQHAAYTTPYLQLMLQAIDNFQIGASNRPKKDVLVEWFRNRTVGGQPVSAIMANYLATFIRQPETQKGGNRKWSQGATPT